LLVDINNCDREFGLQLGEPVALEGLAWAAPLRGKKHDVVTFWPLDLKLPVISDHHGHDE
jgi:hypothetical protein